MSSVTMLIACPSCSCHAFSRETHCPGCGAQLRAADGSLQRTAGAAFLGLTLAFSLACSSETGSGSTGSGGEGGAGGGSVSSSSGFQTMSTYGTATSGGFGGSSSSTGGAGGAGGSK